jgi:signal transduction histidine kinase
MTARLDNERLSILVHEVRSPVAALSAVAEAMRQGPVDDATRDELFRLGLSACRGIERIVMDVAVVSVRIAPVDVAELVHDAVGAFAVRGANVRAQVDGGHLIVDGDRVRLRQAVDNLIANALVHGDGVDAIRVHAIRSPTGVEISVSNSGAGMSSEDTARIFEVGVRLTDSAPGSGLGLPLTRAIVDAHGGVLEVESTAGAGATFTIALPARAPQPAT